MSQVTIHFAKKIRWRVIAACGRWAIDETTTDPGCVTCMACMRTALFTAAGSSRVETKGEKA